MNLVAAALGVAQTIAWACTYYLPAVIAGPVASELDMPLVLVVGAFSAALLVAGFAAPRVGRAIEARGGRGVLALSAPMLAAGLALMGLLPGLAGWILAWLVTGLGMAMGLYDAAFSALGRLYGRSARRSITIVTLFAGFASTLAFPAGAVLLPELGWRGLCLLYAGLHLAVVLPLYLAFVPRAAPVEAAPNAAPDAGPTADAAALRRAFRWWHRESTRRQRLRRGFPALLRSPHPLPIPWAGIGSPPHSPRQPLPEREGWQLRHP